MKRHGVFVSSNSRFLTRQESPTRRDCDPLGAESRYVSAASGYWRKSWIQAITRRPPPRVGLVFRIVIVFSLFAGMLAAGANPAAASYVKITSPSNGATVNGTITITTSENSSVRKISAFVDSL